MCLDGAHEMLHPVRFDVEISLKWADENPALFVKAIHNFVDKIGDEYYPDIIVDRRGFITLQGILKSENHSCTWRNA